MSLSPYFMNVALHALLLSAAVSLALVFVGRPARRAALAAAAVVGLGVLPWVSALLPRAEDLAQEEAPVQAIDDFAGWRVMTIPASDFTVPQVPVAGAAPDFSLPSAWTLAAWAWLAGSLVALAVTAVGLARLGHWRASLRKPDADEAAVLSASMPAGLAMGKIRLSKAACSPCVTGFVRPLLVLPDDLLDSCSVRELAWVLRHEQGHFTGRDSRWTLLMALVRALFWWNPFVHHLAKRWAAAREEVCDLHAEADERSSYGDFLIRMAATCPAGWMLAAPMVGGAKRRLKKRLVSFLNAPERVDLKVGSCFIAGIAMVLPLLGLCTSCVRIGEREKQSSPAAAEAPILSTVSGDKQHANGPHLQVKLSNRVLSTFAPPTVKNGEVLSPDELQQLMVKAATTRGNLLMTFPTITMRNSESGTIEMIREKPLSAGQERVTAGWELQQTPRYDGKSLRLSNQLRYAFVPGKQYSLTSQKDFDEEEPELSKSDWAKLVVKTGSSEAKVPEGHAVITTLGEVIQGMHSILITEVTPIDLTGRSVSRYRDAIYTIQPRELVQGSVRVSAMLLPATQMSEMDAGLKHDPLTLASHIVGLFTREQWQLVKKDLKPKALADATLPAGKALSPWKELPEMLLQAERYKGESMVSLDLWAVESGGSRSGKFVRQGLILAPGTTVIFRIPAMDKKELPRYVALTLEEVK